MSSSSSSSASSSSSSSSSGGAPSGDTVTLLWIRDLHNEPRPREVAAKILASGEIAYFFMEFQNTAQGRDGTSLNGALAKLKASRTNRAAASKALLSGGYFKGLAGGDAEPALPTLAGIAIEAGVRVVAADADYEQTMERIRAHPDGGPRVSQLALFGPLGLELRDRSASRLIAHFLTEHVRPGSRVLVLWGSNHFDADEYRPGLHDMIAADFATRVKERGHGYHEHRGAYAWRLVCRELRA